MPLPKVFQNIAAHSTASPNRNLKFGGCRPRPYEDGVANPALQVVIKTRASSTQDVNSLTHRAAQSMQKHAVRCAAGALTQGMLDKKHGPKRGVANAAGSRAIPSAQVLLHTLDTGQAHIQGTTAALQTLLVPRSGEGCSLAPTPEVHKRKPFVCRSRVMSEIDGNVNETSHMWPSRFYLHTQIETAHGDETVQLR